MEKSVNKRKNTMVFCMLLSVAVLFTLGREICLVGAVRGFSFCLGTLIPAVFPFCVVCKLLVRTVYISPLGVILTGLVCGAPTGAYMCADMYKNGCCTKRSAENLCAVTNGMTPTFVIGFVGIYCLNDVKKGIIVYLVCSLSAILYALVVIKHTRLTPCYKDGESFFTSFTESVTESIFSVISLSGFTVFFSVICEFLNVFFYFLPPQLLSFIFLVNEIITGILHTSALSAVISERLLFALMCAFTSFSGICIHLQIATALSRTGLSSRPFAVGKCVQSLTSFVISYIVYGIIFV